VFTRLATAILVGTTAFAAGGGTPASAADAEVYIGASVVSVEENADGSVTETAYTPAEDVDVLDLASALRERGVTHVSIRTAAEVTPSVAACANGSARTWPSPSACFVKWAKSGAARPVIDFVDHASSRWPVGRAVTEWNRTSGIDSIYRPASAGCDGSPAHCVQVTSGNYGNVGWVGQTSRTTNAAQTYFTHANVKFNDYYASSALSNQWNSACHELGHVLGLGHNTSSGSCMYYRQSSQRYPSNQDVALLERYY
jgi:hypothetical protein